MSRSAGLLLIFLVVAISVLAGLVVGSVPIPLAKLVASLAHPDGDAASAIIWRLRVPRLVAGFSCGALLALAGTLMQALLRNPLADPYVFGISGGAALGVMFGMLLGLGAAMQTGFGLAGASLASILVFGFSLRAGNWNPYRLLLTGVVVAAGLNALLSLILVLSPQAAVKGMLFWLMGDLGYAGTPWPALIVAVLLLILAIPFTPAMNALVLGRMKAKSLGVAVNGIEATLIAIAAVAAVTAVLVGGTIGFVGLVVPHIARLAGFVDHRWLVPVSMLLGGSLLTLADTVARSAWAPLQFPVGVLTALLGVPVLLLLLAGKGRHAAH
ncbi:MAG TPA: iron ABC transporter permease [Burkholderiales bacterium]|nr:iron ABC transporter permease [Burkholderiales bacterium]